MKTKITLILLLSIFLSFNCGKKENPLEKERKEMNEFLEDNIPLTIYKGTKVTLRSIPIDKSIKSIDSLFSGNKTEKKSSQNIQKYTLFILQKLFAGSDSSKSFSISEYVQLISDFRNLKKELKNTDEDLYPTILEVFCKISEISSTEKNQIFKELAWNNSKEHFVLSVLLEAVKQLPITCQLYELSKLDIETLEDTEIKPLAGLFKGIVFIEQKWYYLSDEALSHSIEALESGQIKFEYNNFPAFFEGTKVTEKDAQILQLHAITVLLRGFARYKTEDDDMKIKSLKDFEAFLEDAQKLGLDNELVWFTGAYVYISKEENTKALEYLNKLEKSELLSEDEKEAITEVKENISDRKPDKATNALFDKFFMGKLVLTYFYKYVSSIDWYEKMNNSETGKKMIEIPNLLKNEYEKVGKNIDPEGIKQKGNELLKKVF